MPVKQTQHTATPHIHQQRLPYAPPRTRSAIFARFLSIKNAPLIVFPF